jgi:alpha-beta hydrolase superfamily lysophospholipase
VITVSPAVRPAVANVLMVHGLGDHPARHLPTARRLAGRGYRTILLELAGHGGHAGEWARTLPVYETYARASRSSDVLASLRQDGVLPAEERRRQVARQYARLEQTRAHDHLGQMAAVLAHLDDLSGARDLPLFLVGHSMGGLLAHETAWRMDVRLRSALAGVVLIAPAFRPQGNPESPVMQAVVNGIWALRRAPVSATRTAFKSMLDLNFGVDTSWGDKWLSDLGEEVELFGMDPLIPHRLPTRYASSIESLMAESSRRGPLAPYDGLVIVPSRDGITSREAGANFARRANAAGGARVALLALDVVAHDLLRSSARERALSAMGDWLDGRLRALALSPDAHRAAS